MSHNPLVHDFHDPVTGTWQYIVVDESTKVAAIIDPVLDFDPATAVITTKNAELLLQTVLRNGYTVDYIFETHVHADHLTAAAYLKNRLAQQQPQAPRVCIGKRITAVQELVAKRYGIDSGEWRDAFDKLVDDDEEFSIGSLNGRAIHLPGHTPDHMGYKVQDNIFCGDSLFNVDIGSARCDFPGGNADNLYDSAQTILRHDEHVSVWTGHDYPSQARGAAKAVMTVGEHRKQNKHLKDGVERDQFVQARQARDASLAEPRLIHHALQVNIRAGNLPREMQSGDRFLHVPIKVSTGDWSG